MRKMDEMELSIRNKGIKWSWFFMVMALLLWGVYDYVKTQSASLPFILIAMQFLVYFFVTNIAKASVGDESGKKQIWSLGVVLLLMIVFGVILFFVVGRAQ